jgi:ATP-dependent DNA helicase DinG
MGPEGGLAQLHQAYVERAGQTAMAGAVAETILQHSILVAEAGTGTGKTYAYLVPALLSGQPVMISTGTRTLQDQLFRRDLPEVCRALRIVPRTALLKGRANYVCLYHLRRNLAEGRFERREDIAVLRRIDRFAKLSASGDRAEAAGIPEDAPAWSKAISTRDNCLGQDCPDLAQCFVFRARQAAQGADVLVVNHHLFCADLALRDEGISDLLPEVRTLIFDEAHQLPEIATQFFGQAISSRQLIDFARDLTASGIEEAPDAEDWRSLGAALEDEARSLRVQSDGVGRRDRDQLREDTELQSSLAELSSRLGHVLGRVQAAAERGRELTRLAGRGVELFTRLERWRTAVLQSKDEPSPRAVASPQTASPEAIGSEGAIESIEWAEFSASGVVLHSTPLSLAASFRKHVEGVVRSWVFASATLAVNGRFDHFTDALGLESARCERWDSPFDFDRQALIWVPEDCGDPSGPEFAQRVADLAWKLVRVNRGRAFLLCTSLRMVEQLSLRLQQRIQQAGLTVAGIGLELLVQGSASRSELLDRFRSAKAPVLIGSASFWEGVDVVGDQLSLVLIDKLPFAPPDDPVLRARSDALRRAGGDPFGQLQLPSAALSLKQGVGRLIRSERDRGLIVICDERLVRRSYGRTLIRSLPAIPVTRDGVRARAWIEAGKAPPAGSAEDLPPATLGPSAGGGG